MAQEDLLGDGAFGRVLRATDLQVGASVELFWGSCPNSTSPLGIILFIYVYFCLYKSQEDVENMIFIKVLRGG